MKKQITIIKPPTIEVERLSIDKKVFQALTAEEQRDQLRKHYGPYAKDLPYERQLSEVFDVPNKHAGRDYGKRRWEELLSNLKEFKHQDEIHRRYNITASYLNENVKALAKTPSLATNTGKWRAEAERVLADAEPLPFGKLFIRERGYSHDLIFKLRYEEGCQIYHTVRPCEVKEKDLLDPDKYVDGWHGKRGGLAEQKLEECHDVIEHYHRQVIMCLVLSQTREMLKANLGDKEVAPGLHLEASRFESMHDYK